MSDPDPTIPHAFAHELAPGSVIAGRFTIESRAGAGGMGAVYRARDGHNGAAIALKVMTGHGAKGVERFDQEAAVLRGLDDPGIVRYVAHGRAEAGPLFLAMEWLQGEDLATRLERSSLTISSGVRLAARVAAALGAAHARGIVHRDIKPSNLFLPDGDVERVKILDFGIARTADRAAITTGTGNLIGTPGYMAPEQARGASEIDARADVFSLGCVLYKCVTGRSAFEGAHVVAILAKILFEEPPRLRERGIDGADELDALLVRMLAKDPQQRPVDGTALAVELTALGGLESVVRSPPSVAVALTRSEQRLLSVVVVGRVPDSVRPVSTQDATLVSLADAGDDEMRAAVHAFGAHVERLLDGSVVATLTGHGAATDLAARAARCALALRALFRGVPMALATGRGEVAGAVPIGEVIDRAASLMRETRGAHDHPGIRLDAVTAGLLDTRFDVVGSVGGLDLVAEREPREQSRRLLGTPTRCVGRERELALLRGIFEECIEESSPRLVLVTAAAGVGKSRLRAELLAQLATRSEPVGIWESRADPMSAGAPFVMIAPMLRRIAGLVDGEPVEVRRRKLAARVARQVAAGEQARITEFLGELVGTPFPSDASPPLRMARGDAIVMGDQVRRAFIDLLAAECAAQPLVLILEDLHWGDVPSMNLLDAAVRAVRDRPWMILALARPELRATFPNLWEGRGPIHVELRELSPIASGKLVRQVLGASVADATVDRVVAQAAGNAFYLEELIRAVAEGRSDTLPGTVAAMVQTRLEALGPETRRALRAASVFGEVFWRGGVAKLLDVSSSAAELSARLADLEDKELIAEQPTPAMPGEVEYRFRHAVVRDVAYEMLTPGDRMLGHKLAGAWLEDCGSPDAVVVAEHLERGGEPGRAVGWYRRAAEEALSGNDFDAAIARANRGLACGASSPTEGALYIIRSDAHAWNSDHASALDDARRAAAVFANSVDGRDAWVRSVGRVLLECRRLGKVDDAVTWAETLLAAWHPKDRSSAMLVAACHGADTLFLLGRPIQAKVLIDRIEGCMAQLGEIEPHVVGYVCRVRGLRGQLDGDPSGLATWLDRSIAAFDEAGDIRSACIGRANRGYSLLVVGDYAQSERELRIALEAASTLRLLTLVSLCEHNLGLALGSQGRIDEGIIVERAAVAGFTHRNDVRLECSSRTYLARLLLERGDIEEARAEAERAVALAHALAASRAQALATLARVRLIAAEPQRALQAAHDAMTILAELGSLENSEELIRLVYAEALHATGDPRAATVIAEARRHVLARTERIASAQWRTTYLQTRESVRTLALAAEWIGAR